MSNIYEVFNVTNDYELSKVFDKLDLSYNEMTNIDYIVESMNKENARNKILEIMAGSADGNYEVCLEQFAKTIKKRVLKEESGLNLNQIMELNKLVELVASKLSANQQQCLEGIYNIISQKAGVNAAKTFIGMVQQSSVNQSSLKFNTDLVVDGKNLAQVIYALKNEIEIFCNSIKKEESEKEEVKESLNESYESYKHIIQELDKAVDDVSDINVLKSIAERVNTLLGKVKNMNEANEIASLKTTIETKMNSLMDVKPQLEECCLATQVAQDVCGEDTFNGLLDSVKPTVINITVNKEDNGILPCLDNCCDVPCSDVPCCDVPCNDCENTDIAPIVQPMNFEPTAIDAPILRKPNSAEVTSAITALSSHTNDIKSDSRENNLENLQTINTLLGQISNYFNTLLGESVEYKRINEGILGAVAGGLIGKKVGHPFIGAYAGHKIQDKFFGKKDKPKEKRTYVQRKVANKINPEVLQELYDVIAENYGDDWLIDYDEVDYMELLDTVNDFGNEIDGYDDSLKYEYAKALKEKWIEEHREQLDEEKTLPSGDYTVVAYDIVVDEYFEGEYNIHEKKVLKIHHNANASLDEEIKEAILEDMGESYNGNIKVVDYEYQIVDRVTDEQLDEETVYDHSWFEVEGQKYPKRTKNGVEGLPIKETCSAGACCAASVATVPSKPKKAKSKPRKQESFDVSLFKESVRNDCPVTLTINDKMVSYKLVEGKGYLYIDNGIVKTLDKDVMLETIDDVYNNCLDIDVLEGYNAYELNILLEDELNSDMSDVDSVTTITPDEKKKAQTELDNNLAQKPNAKINVVSSENNGEIHQNQEFIGIDDHDESNKKYIVKDPATGKITVADYNQIKIAEN